MATTTRVLNANVTGTVYNTNLNSTLEALDTSHSGPTAPTDEVVNGKLWLDTSTTPSVLKVYDNGGWNEIYTDRGNLSIDGNDVTSTAAELNVLDGISGIASQAEAEAGVVTDKLMTPLRVLQSIDANSLSPFTYNAVSGVTQALDVGSYNFFDAGTLTADTTVSFSSVPTEARWTYTATADVVSTPWDITDLSYVRNFSVAVESLNPQSVFFKPDGTAMYVVSSTNVDEYSLSTAWDISTVSYTRTFGVSTQEANPTGLFFKPDGTAMYIVGYTGDDVNEYSLSTAWDISTASYVRVFSVAAQETTPFGIFFKPDGTAMYITGSTGDDVNEYSLSTAWDISTASYVRVFSVAAQETAPQGIFFKPDGTSMYIVGYTGDDVNEYSLSTAWDISTASYVRVFSVAAQETAPQGIFFKPDGTKMYMVGATGDDVNEYSLGPLAVITLPSSVQNPPSEALVPETQVSYTFFTADGGTTVKLTNEEVL